MKQYHTEILVQMYTEQHLTLREIAKLHKVSHTCISKRLMKAGVSAQDGTWVPTNCGYCGDIIQVRRAIWKKNMANYCNDECYFASRENEGYVPWRQGQRIARVLVSKYFSLEKAHVVDHIDGDNRNNKIFNLRVYASQSDYMKMHHGKHMVAPLWDGSIQVVTPLPLSAALQKHLDFNPFVLA